MMERFLRITARASVVMIMLCMLSLTSVSAQAVISKARNVQNQLIPATCGKWSVVPSPNGNGQSGLGAIAVVSPTAIWAIGNVDNPFTRVKTTLTEFWDGTQWSIVPSPSPSPMYNNLYGVAAISSNDVWTVGFDVNDVGITQTLTEHWNGSSWQVIPSPSPGAENNQLFNVKAISARNVWAVGFTTDSTFAQKTLIEHWNGAQWQVVASPSPIENESLSSIAAVSATDIWAVGTSNGSPTQTTLIEHWNGARWRVVSGGDAGGELRGVAVASANDVWTVGDTTGSSASQALIEHWNGLNWNVINNPSVGTSSLFSAVAVVSSSDVWAVGSDNIGNSFFQTLIEHWNGSGWSVVPSPSPGSFSTQLLGVAAVSSDDIWAVGYADGNTLIEHNRC